MLSLQILLVGGQHAQWQEYRSEVRTPGSQHISDFTKVTVKTMMCLKGVWLCFLFFSYLQKHEY